MSSSLNTTATTYNVIAASSNSNHEVVYQKLMQQLANGGCQRQRPPITSYPLEHHQADHYLSSINFRSGYEYHHASNAQSLLCFGQKTDGICWNQEISKCSTGTTIAADHYHSQLLEKVNSDFENNNGIDHHGGDWPLYSDSTIVAADSVYDSVPLESAYAKRPNSGDYTIQVAKKQCNSSTKKMANLKNPSKDPQSIAAKNRRERISERLKVLQELVPNGSKVDLVTMLEKAISYVKFLQLQVKVLATDELWPVQGSKAPDIPQVKEAIDLILSSQRDRNSSS